ncbi:MAG: hypothetical protein KKD31_12810, partial [Bacteroidetes bacterium]|nr:hypothetical protein [Bacteroidota bacterium]
MDCYDCMRKNCIRSGIDKNKHYSFGSYKYNVFDWLADIEVPPNQMVTDFVEVRFKNGRKDFYRNINKLEIVGGDMVAVEASPGHDIGMVTLTGEIVKVQIKRKGVKIIPDEAKKVYRLARPADIEKRDAAKTREIPVLHKSREIAARLKLDMKITDVEFQGDGTKAIFYYSADDRVDFRELIKKYAEEFRIRIEMKQIGVRQEASRLGGIGSCGRELCCSTWLNSFQSVSTGAARTQQLSLNPQKLAGQCAKLKCCLNFEQDCYLDILSEFPDTNIILDS